jgi:hypothetical protein
MTLGTRCVEEHQPTEMKSAEHWGKAMMMAYKITRNFLIRLYTRKTRNKDGTS